MRTIRLMSAALVIAISLLCGFAAASASPAPTPDSAKLELSVLSFPALQEMELVAPAALPGLFRPSSHAHAMTSIETVTIQHPDVEGERMIINASDFNPEVHKRFDESDSSQPPLDDITRRLQAAGTTSTDSTPGSASGVSAGAADSPAGTQSTGGDSAPGGSGSADASTSTGKADGPDPNALPAGYEAKHVGGGKYKALVDSKPLRDATSDAEVKFESKDAAIAALREFAAAQAPADPVPPAE